jgi:glutamate N-acetyltransferase / amino-acid N-acetyltransferase
MKKIDGGVLAAKGFRAGAAAAGIKSDGSLDVALVWSDTPALTAAIFTQNSVVAAPVQLSQRHCRDHKVRAIAVNSGNANCMTGATGKLHAKQMALNTGRLLDIDASEVLIASTGIIGRPLPIDKVQAGLQMAFDSQSPSAGNDFAKAIMTTDTGPKNVAYACEIDSKRIVIGGCAKGSGMMQPNMATMLSFLTSDVAISPELLGKALKEAARTTFNTITVDGCTSTNDTLALMTNGQAGNPQIVEEDAGYVIFLETLRQACLDLALMIVRDGEGATILITVRVDGAENYDQAKLIAYVVANSPLVKTAAHGKTGNWGRIAQAVGTLGLAITEDSLDITASSPADDALDITITIKLGAASATVYTCDLSKEYVDINVEYN